MKKNKLRLATKALVWQVAVFLVSALTLFLSAGTLVWFAGWIFLVLFFGFVFLLSIWLLRYCPDLLEERLALFKPNQKHWDKVFLLLFYALSLVWLALMPLDAVRSHWSQIPVWLAGVGILLLLCALAGIFMTVQENRYLSPTVRLQEERNHVVVSTGVYGYVRHPLYASAFLFYVGVPLLLGSWLGFVLAPVFMGLLVLRAVLEERMLQKELLGYQAYMAQVRSRFIPHIW